MVRSGKEWDGAQWVDFDEDRDVPAIHQRYLAQVSNWESGVGYWAFTEHWKANVPVSGLAIEDMKAWLNSFPKNSLRDQEYIRLEYNVSGLHDDVDLRLLVYEKIDPKHYREWIRLAEGEYARVEVDYAKALLKVDPNLLWHFKSFDNFHHLFPKIAKALPKGILDPPYQSREFIEPWRRPPFQDFFKGFGAYQRIKDVPGHPEYAEYWKKHGFVWRDAENEGDRGKYGMNRPSEEGWRISPRDSEPDEYLGHISRVEKWFQLGYVWHAQGYWVSEDDHDYGLYDTVQERPDVSDAMMRYFAPPSVGGFDTYRDDLGLWFFTEDWEEGLPKTGLGAKLQGMMERTEPGNFTGLLKAMPVSSIRAFLLDYDPAKFLQSIDDKDPIFDRWYEVLWTVAPRLQTTDRGVQRLLNSAWFRQLYEHLKSAGKLEVIWFRHQYWRTDLFWNLPKDLRRDPAVLQFYKLSFFQEGVPRGFVEPWGIPPFQDFFDKIGEYTYIRSIVGHPEYREYWESHDFEWVDDGSGRWHWGHSLDNWGHSLDTLTGCSSWRESGTVGMATTGHMTTHPTTAC